MVCKVCAVDRTRFSVEEALRSATSLPANYWGLSDRGRIALGMRADLLLVKGNMKSPDVRNRLDEPLCWEYNRSVDEKHDMVHSVGMKILVFYTNLLL